MATPVLEMQNVEKNFGGVRAIDNFSVMLEPGKIHGLIGPNGAGKTTIFNNITGIYAPDSGKIIFNGTDITGQRAPSGGAAGHRPHVPEYPPVLKPLCFEQRGHRQQSGRHVQSGRRHVQDEEVQGAGEASGGKGHGPAGGGGPCR